ncbi:MAG: hypothetical protein A3F70_03580 [Acidobacteria bacterium RIFCSPLOWO2_12_FULL_67_14]|nr:MAG: hypothetical protein A3H29_15810 [Acidobacteria bacterium RIFCSPLOWO2_02_FULL_67_21]OFW40078.1 MAG: hypothetical protein A3F70_03580 [Acidobacteria bacterium RIFCSPLOWO2_12_FULL_67_14]
MTDRESYWLRVYRDLHRRAESHLDYASAEEQAFAFAACLLAAGSVAGMRCLDAGCGTGGFARLLRAAGAREVVAVDFVEDTIAGLRRSDPDIRWQAGSLNDAERIRALGTFDRVLAIEVLQYVSPSAMFDVLWSVVAPGGRLIGYAPNADSSFVQRTMTKFQQQYAPLSQQAVSARLSSLPDLAEWGVMGLRWREGSRSVPYDFLPFTSAPDWPDPPKRLLFMARKM